MPVTVKDPNKLYFCEKCGRTMKADQFYTSNNLEKYPDGGKLKQCRKCITMHVDNWDPNTFLWILQEVDVPYMPDEWKKLMLSYAKDPSKVTGMTIIGRYLAKMKLKQYRDYRWSDNEFLQEIKNNEIKQTMERQGYSAAEITQAIEKASFDMPSEELQEPQYNDFETPSRQADEEEEDYFDKVNGFSSDDFDMDLTEEEKLALRLKWGKSYKPEEWVQLERLYNDMMNSYDIQTAGHIDTLKLICKTSLKANQLIDLGDKP